MYLLPKCCWCFDSISSAYSDGTMIQALPENLWYVYSYSMFSSSRLISPRNPTISWFNTLKGNPLSLQQMTSSDPPSSKVLLRTLSMQMTLLKGLPCRMREMQILPRMTPAGSIMFMPPTEKASSSIDWKPFLTGSSVRETKLQKAEGKAMFLRCASLGRTISISSLLKVTMTTDLSSCSMLVMLLWRQTRMCSRLCGWNLSATGSSSLQRLSKQAQVCVSMRNQERALRSPSGVR